MENNTPKKVLIFSMSYYPRFVGGAEVTIKEITDRLGKGQYEFHLITLRYDSLLPAYEKVGNVHVYRIGFTQKNPSLEKLRMFPLRLNKILYQFWAPCVGWWLHKKVKFEKVWAMMAHSAGVPGNIFSFITHVPLLLTLQEGDPTEKIEKQMRIFGPLFTGVFRRAEKVQSISTFLESWAIRMGTSSLRTCVVPNGVDEDMFLASTHKKQTDSFVVITTSRLVPKNGIDILVRSLLYTTQDVVLHIVGDGYQKKELEDLVRDQGLEERVTFFGHKDKEEVIRLLQHSDVFARPSRSEGLGNSFLEAMAAGVPIVATPVGGIPDFLIDPALDEEGATGLACRVDDPESLALSIMKYKNDPQLYARIKKNGQVLVTKQYTWASVADRMSTIL